jgi:hypothetical protein
LPPGEPNWLNDLESSPLLELKLMRAVFSSLVAASLLIHAAIGCCWHHPHNDDDTCCDDSQTGSHHDSEQGGHSHGPCKDHCQGTCHYLPVQKSQVDKITVHSLLDFAAIVPATCEVPFASQLRASRTHESAAEPPVRLHLLHQILLI